jgi:hypothetical protein
MGFSINGTMLIRSRQSVETVCARTVAGPAWTLSVEDMIIRRKAVRDASRTSGVDSVLCLLWLETIQVYRRIALPLDAKKGTIVR